MNKSSPIPEFRVLIVEDDSATRLLLKKVVTKAGYFTDEASSAEVALELIQKNKYHIVVTDIGLPGQDGLELLQEIKKRDPLIQVVMLTGEVTMSRTLQTLEFGATDFSLKPVDVEELLMIIRMCEGKILRWWGIMRAAFRRKKKEEKQFGAGQ